jgi:ribosomal protein RSM22 (predicted rRNA methylase)
MNLFKPLPAEVQQGLDNLLACIEKAFPLPRRFRLGLPGDVADLSRLLTSERGDLSASYLGKPNLLSAYLRYFLPWNVYRLCKLLPGLPLGLADGDIITDLGSGPFTLVLALWISRPDLRKLKLEFRCLDRTGAVLESGKKLFAALVQAENKVGSCLWAIKAIKSEARRNGTLSAQIHGEKAKLVTAINLYNELFQDLSPADSEGLNRLAEQHAGLLASLAQDEGKILIMEPGVPRSGEFIAALRKALLDKGCPPASPCTHNGACPLPGGRIATGKGFGKAKWCHFAFETGDAPGGLHKLSAAAGIPKERAVLSFIFAGKELNSNTALDTKTVEPTPEIKVRVISDAFPLPHYCYGRYGCSEKGLTLISGNKAALSENESGSLLDAKLTGKESRDEKSGALIINN